MKSRMIGTVVAFALAVVSALTVTADDVTLPAGYTKLGYIESTGTQWINTGIKLPHRTSLAVDFGYLTQEGSLFGCKLAQGGYLFLVGSGSAKFYGTDATSLLLGGEAIRALGSNKFRLEIAGGDGTQESGWYMGQMTITQEGGTKILDGKKVGTSSGQNDNFGVFANGTGGGRSAYRLYGLSATDPDGRVLLDLVPCIDPDGEIGVYDLAGNRFLPNSGTGTFLAPSDDDHDLVENGCFDNSQITDVGQGWNYGGKCTCPGWTMEGSIGLGKPGCTFVNASLYVGNWAMFLQSNGSKDLVALQTVTVEVPGDYTLRFAHALRSATAGPVRAELYDAAGNLVGNKSTTVTGTSTTAYKREEVSYPGLVAGDYTLKFIKPKNSADETTVLDCVSMRPDLQYVEAGGGLFVYDGDFSLENVSLEGKDRILKCGTGDLKVPAVCAALPAVRVRSGALDAQDDAATAYTVDGALILEDGVEIKIDMVGGACDSFAVNSLSLSGKILIAVKGSTTDSMCGQAFTLISGAGLTEVDLEKFDLNTNLPLELIVDTNGDLKAKVVLPAGYTKLDYIESTGTQYINTGIKLPNRTSLEIDFGYLTQEGNLFGCNLAQGGYLFLVGSGSAKFYGTDATSLLLGGEAIRALGSNKFRLEIAGGDGTQESGWYMGQMTITKEDGTKILDGKKVGTSSVQSTNFGVFANGTGGGCSAYRLYGLSATDPDGKVLFDLVPCINPDGVIGVYDLAGNRFLPNNGTGTFLTPSDDEHDLIENGCFDNSQITDVNQGWNYGGKCMCPGWAMEGSIGLGKPGCTFVNASLYTGNWAMFLQSNGSQDLVASQTVTVDVPGDHTLRFAHALRSATAGSVRAELYDAAGNLVGNKSTTVTGTSTTAYKREEVSYPGLAAGDYTLKFVKPKNTVDETTVLDCVSMRPDLQYVEAGGGLFVYDGDFSLENVSLEGKDRILKSGTGDLSVPAACAALPAVRVRSGALDAQDGVATAYTVDGALRIDGGATLKVDLVNGACDSFAVTALDVSAASKSNRIFIDIPASVGNERVSGSHLLVSGAGLSESDAAKFKTVGMKGSFSVKNGDLCLDAPKGLFIVVQ